ncbi:MAG TPA: adenylate/guanylate cyclase domain-containing protein [Mycobacterium sp.]|nr:adenylate/guanylate cyclase domain-containing protein [Mycobacterium sp.]HZA11851.1 adenylate/guanylate cyclase domain-containing protein [Mycobacterium sp.]
MGPVDERDTSIDELLDRAVRASNRGDRAAATALAGQVLAVDDGNADAEDLLAAPRDSGEIRRLTILFADLVDSTALSRQVEPETYRMVVGNYREQVLRVVERYEGHVGSTKGDGLLAVFGHPRAHDNDVCRAVAAGLEITREVARLSDQAQRRFGVQITVRVGVHRGLVYLDTSEDDVYGLAANLAARVAGLAPPGTVVVSDAVASLVQDAFDLAPQPPAPVKGVDGLVSHHRVLNERIEAPRVGNGERSPLVGRRREQARLEKSWARAQAGTLKTPGVVFRGEPGIGKSRLASAATELVACSGAVVLELVGSPFHTDAGLHPVRTLLERRCGIGRRTVPAERLGLLEAEVRSRSLDPVTTVPLLAPVLGIDAVHGYTPAPAEGRKLYELIAQAVQDYLLACVGDGAGLVVADDLQWFDPSTLEVIGSLLASASGRLLVVMAGRPGSWLHPDWPVKEFDLPPLTEEESDELITALDPTLGADDRAVVRDRCDGVPFYIEQVVGGLTETGVPEALYEPLFARLRASAYVVPVAEAAGVIGRHIDRSLLAAVCGLTENDLDDVLDHLEAAKVLEPWGTDGWRFRHELLRELAYELAPPSVRRALHAQVADALVHGVGGEPDWRLVAGHYEQAARLDEATSAYQQASAAARRRGALAEARTYLSLAITQLDRTKPGPDRDRREIAARLERGFLTGAAEGHSSQAAVADFERCLQLAGTNLHGDELVATLAALMGYYEVRGDLRRAVHVGELLSTRVGEDRQWFRPAIEALFGVVALLLGEFAAARRHCEQATAGQNTADQIDAVWFLPNEPIASAYINLALADFVRGDLAGAEAALADAQRRVDQYGFPKGPYTLAYARFVEIWIQIECGQLDRAALSVDELLDRSERYGFDQWRLVGATEQGIVHALASLPTDGGEPTGLADHIATITSLLDLMRALGLSIYLTFVDAFVARLLIGAGQPERARARLDVALTLAADSRMHFYDAELLRLRAQTHPDSERRQRDIGAALEIARRQGATLFELRAALDDYHFRGQPARHALADVARRLPRDSACPDIVRAQAILDHAKPKSG